MANGSRNYYETPSQRRPIRAGEPRRISEPVVLPMETSRSGVVLAGLLGIGLGAVLFGVWAVRALDGDAQLGPTSELPSRAPAFTVNPGFEQALALPMASLPGTAESPETTASMSDDAAAQAAPEAGSTEHGSSQRDTDQRFEEERELDERRQPVSGGEPQSSSRERLDAFGRDVGSGTEDFAIEGPSGTAPERLEIERKERMDMAPTESFPGARPGSEPPSTTGDNPY